MINGKSIVQSSCDGLDPSAITGEVRREVRREIRRESQEDDKLRKICGNLRVFIFTGSVLISRKRDSELSKKTKNEGDIL